jgi:vesicle transport through interaction with t-SNAREs protein 1
MTDLLDSEPGSELFSSYEAELKLVLADLRQKLEQLPDLSVGGEPRKAAAGQAKRALDEAREIVEQMRLEKQNVPASARAKVNARFRNCAGDVDELTRRVAASADGEREALFGQRYRDEEGGVGDPLLEQRQQLLSGTERLERSSGRLRESQRVRGFDFLRDELC